MRTDTGQIVHLADYRPTDFVLERVDLTFELDPKHTKVEARLIFHRREGVDPQAPLVLDGDELTLSGLLLDQVEIPASQYDATPDSLTIRDLPAETPFEICVTNYINPQVNTQLMGLYRTNGVYCTQCEAEGFRRITYFPDRPDVLAPYTVTIIAAKEGNPLLLSNGNFLGGGNYDEGRHFAAWFDPHPKPSYLFALVAGDLGVVEDSFTTLSGREVALKIYVEHGKEPRAAYAMDALKRSMKWDEERFGREYDLDIFMIVAVSDFNMGAMENKGLNVFNDKFVLADPETASDADYANIERIIAHEYFHNWTGNRITCRDWFQLCLKEGLTVYRDQEFSADMRSRPVKRIADGAEVTRMIATILGADDFKKGMDLYFERHDGEAATVEDFVKSFADASGRDLSQFSLWYTEAGTPLVSVSSAYDAGKARSVDAGTDRGADTRPAGKTATAHSAVASADPRQWSDRRATGSRRRRIPRWRAAPDRAQPDLLLLRHFVAAGAVDQPQLLGAGQSAFRAECRRSGADRPARDGYALTDLALPALIAATKAVQNGGEVRTDAELIATLIEIVGDSSLEPLSAHRRWRCPAKRISPRTYSPDADSAGRRSLRNGALTFLAFAEGTPERAAKAYADATNMTDLAHALSVLTQRFPDSAETKEALAAFETRFADNALVLDKWFSLQAAIPGDGALERIKALMKSKHFIATNPNRVRSLVGTLAFANPTGFHRADGAAYRFLAEQIIAIDKRNPQLAARILTSMRSWRSLEASRAEHARAALSTIADTKGLSTDAAYRIAQHDGHKGPNRPGSRKELQMTDMSKASASFQRFMTDAPAHSAAWLQAVQKLGVASTLDVKTQSLIYIGILAALRLESGIAFHVMEAKARGASREDIISAVLAGLPAAGNGVVNALHPALDAFDGV
ncbi:hypothetical protein Lal_00012877 [Lupinus albus]|nr:hypothetical protein Lal_00012877 [Lupinus albus]